MDDTTIEHIMSTVSGSDIDDYQQNIRYNDMTQFVQDIEHRMPFIKNTSNNPSNQTYVQHNLVKNPSDPVSSVSSNEDMSPQQPDQNISTNNTSRNVAERRQEPPTMTKTITTRDDPRGDPRVLSRRPAPRGGQQPARVLASRTVEIKKNTAADVSPDSAYDNTDNGNAVANDNTVDVTDGTVIQDADTNIPNMQYDVPDHMTSLMGYLIPTKTLYFILVITIIATVIYFLTAEKKKTDVPDEEKEDRRTR